MFKPHALELIKRKRANYDEIAEFCRSPKSFLKYLDKAGIDRAMLINYVAPEVIGFTSGVNQFVADYVKEREHIGKRFTIVVIAEGVKLPPELHQFEQERRKSPRSMTVGMLIGDAIGKAAQKEVRVAVLGHIQRGGQPSPFDRILATQFGAAAVDLIAHGGFGKMVCLHNSRIRSVDIADAIGVLKMVDADGDLVRAARSIGICFGD